MIHRAIRNCPPLQKKGERYGKGLFVENMKIPEVFNSNPIKFLSVLVIESLEFSFEKFKCMFNLKYTLFCYNLNISF